MAGARFVPSRRRFVTKWRTHALFCPSTSRTASTARAAPGRIRRRAPPSSSARMAQRQSHGRPPPSASTRTSSHVTAPASSGTGAITIWREPAGSPDRCATMRPRTTTSPSPTRRRSGSRARRCVGSTIPTKQNSTVRDGHRTRRPSSGSSTYAASEPITFPTAQTCATRRPASGSLNRSEWARERSRSRISSTLTPSSASGTIRARTIHAC